MAPGEGAPGSVEAAFQQTCDILAQSASKVEQLLIEWDTDKNGLIDKKEFRNACRAMGVLFDRAVLDQLFDRFDDDGSGNLDHRELVMKARRAAFAKGFIPKSEAPKPTPVRKLQMYWDRRNRLTMEKHIAMVEARETAANQRRRERLDEHRADLRRTLGEKRNAARQQGAARREKYWMRREREEAAAAAQEQAAAPVRTRLERLGDEEEEIVFLPSLPHGRTLAKQTWAKDRLRIREQDKEEIINEVSKLSDVWVGSIVNAWKQPTAEDVRI